MDRSVIQALSDDPRLLLGAPYALLLQVAHPVVDAGVLEHSNFRVAPWERLRNTLDYLYVMSYGTPEEAGAMGARVRHIHTFINGTMPDGHTPYDALDPDAYAWVHLTLAISIIRSREVFVGRLPPDVKEAFWQQWRELGTLSGVDLDALPRTWKQAEFHAAMTAEYILTRTQSVQDVRQLLANAPSPHAYLPDLAWAMPRHATHQALQTATHLLATPRERVLLGLSAPPGPLALLLKTSTRAGWPLGRMKLGDRYMKKRRSRSPR